MKSKCVKIGIFLSLVLCVAQLAGCKGKSGRADAGDPAAEERSRADSAARAECADSVYAFFRETFYKKTADPLDYLRRAERVAAYVRQLNARTGVFNSDSVAPFVAALNAIRASFEKESGGSQAQINAWSRKMSFLEELHAMKENADLLHQADSTLFAKEYLLWHGYLRRKQLWAKRLYDMQYNSYSSAPMDYCLAEAGTYRERRLQVEAVKRLLAEGVSIPAQGKPVSDEEIRRHFHWSMPSDLRPVRAKDDPEDTYPTDTLGAYFLRWVHFRDTVARRLPARFRQSYRNQTETIRNACADDNRRNRSED